MTDRLSNDYADQLATAEQRIRDQDERISGLLQERSQMVEQLSIRDNRDRDMQEIMRINNELLQERDAQARRIAELEGEVERLRAGQWSELHRAANQARELELARLRTAQHDNNRD